MYMRVCNLSQPVGLSTCEQLLWELNVDFRSNEIMLSPSKLKEIKLGRDLELQWSLW
jgi:hypothetical protein